MAKDILYEKLRILADSAKYDVSCSTSGTQRKTSGRMGNAKAAGICHSWTADGRCVSLLKVLLSNQCVYDCLYCVNRRSAEADRASFEPEELAELTMEFYRRNYIEGLFLSSAVERSPDYTAEKMLKCLSLLRNQWGFSGYIHAKIIPGVSGELVERIGLLADRLSVNIEFPGERSLNAYAPQKKASAIFTPMKQITNTLIERKSLVGPGTMFKGVDVNGSNNYIGGSAGYFALNEGGGQFSLPAVRRGKKEQFAPAGQTTQMIIGAGDESDREILTTSEKLYHTFKMKRVYFSAYIPAVKSPVLPDLFSAPPLAREHRLYQADWLLRFYGFKADEILDDKTSFLDPNFDPKIAWAIKNIDKFPIEINKASFEEILRIPGVGTVSARRIMRHRRVSSVQYDDLKRMGVVLKRAKYFFTCSGKYYGGGDLTPEYVRKSLLETVDEEQLSMFFGEQGRAIEGGNPWDSLRKMEVKALSEGEKEAANG